MGHSRTTSGSTVRPGGGSSRLPVGASFGSRSEANTAGINFTSGTTIANVLPDSVKNELGITFQQLNKYATFGTKGGVLYAFTSGVGGSDMTVLKAVSRSEIMSSLNSYIRRNNINRAEAYALLSTVEQGL